VYFLAFCRPLVKDLRLRFDGMPSVFSFGFIKLFFYIFIGIFEGFFRAFCFILSFFIIS
jgi:hypothetical protein